MCQEVLSARKKINLESRQLFQLMERRGVDRKRKLASESELSLVDCELTDS